MRTIITYIVIIQHEYHNVLIIILQLLFSKVSELQQSTYNIL